MLANFSSPYLKILLALRPLFNILIGFSFSCRNIPARYAQIKAMQITPIIFDNLFMSVRCVSSILNPLDFMALNIVSICHCSLYFIKALCSLLYEAIITNFIPSLDIVLIPLRYK